MKTLEENQPEDVSDDFIEAAMRAAENGAVSVAVSVPETKPKMEKVKKIAETKSVSMAIDDAPATGNETVDSASERSDEALEGVDLYEEVGDLAKYLSGVCSKIRTAEDFMDDASGDLPMGTNQLSEVTRKQEEATQEILDDTDKMIDNDDQMEERLASLKASLFSESLNARDEIKEDVMALCRLVAANKEVMFSLTAKLSFQDATGQQIQKVATMMNTLQARLLKMVVTFGKKSTQKKAKKVSEDRGDQLLEKLNKKEKMEQGLVDSVLSEFGF